MKTVTILLTKYSGLWARVVCAIGNSAYTHASISIDEKEEIFYSFNTKGFVIEKPKKYFPKTRRFGSVCIRIQVLEEVYAKIQREIEGFVANKDAYSYSRLGVILCLLHIPYKFEKELFYRVQEEMMRRASMCKSAVTRKKNQKSKYSSGYALTGILLCGKCGQEYRRVTWARNGKKKIVWRCSNRLTNGVKACGESETIEEGALNRAVMAAIHRITQNDGEFVGAFRQNVIRVIGSYGREQEPDEYEDKIKAKQEEMVALIAENAEIGSYNEEFDEKYRSIAEEINTLKNEQQEARRKKRLAENYEQRVMDMDAFIRESTCQIPEFDNDLVRRLIANIKVVSAEKLLIQFQLGIVMEQEISYD